MIKQVIENNKEKIIPFITLLFIFILWELFLTFLDVSKIVLIKPSVIINTLIRDIDIISGELWYTITEIVPGWIIGNLLGFVVALLIYSRHKLTKNLIRLSVLINAVPLIALTAILGGIMGTDRELKIVIVALIVFFPMFITTLSQLSNIDQGHKDLFYSYSATKNEILIKLLIPRSLPIILNCVKVSVVSAIFTAITAEFFGGYGGIGIFILSKKGLYNLELVWASIFAIAVFGSAFFFSVQYLQHKLVPWQKI